MLSTYGDQLEFLVQSLSCCPSVLFSASSGPWELNLLYLVLGSADSSLLKILSPFVECELDLLPFLILLDNSWWYGPRWSCCWPSAFLIEWSLLPYILSYLSRLSCICSNAVFEEGSLCYLSPFSLYCLCMKADLASLEDESPCDSLWSSRLCCCFLKSKLECSVCCDYLSSGFRFVRSKRWVPSGSTL